MYGLRNLTFLFTGQGSQRVGMTASLEKTWPRLMQRIFDEANDYLRFDLRKILHDGPAEKVTQTSIAQPAILLHSYSILRILQEELDFQITPHICDYVLGHSVGEYSALVAANALELGSAIHLVHQRGKAIEEGMKQYNEPTAMAALLPISSANADLVAQHGSQMSGGQICEVANYNSKRQVVISGHKKAVELAIEYAKKEKRVKKAVMLKVSAPFHCSILEKTGVCDMFSPYLDAVPFHKLSVPIISNVTAKEIQSPHEIRELLKKQVACPVRFTSCLDYTVEQVKEKQKKKGTTDQPIHFIECGYGGVLTGLVRQHFSPKENISALVLGTADELRNFIKEQTQTDVREEVYAAAHA